MTNPQNEKKEIHVFICEDDSMAKNLVQMYFNKGQITFVAVYPEERRQEITEALDKIDDL